MITYDIKKPGGAYVSCGEVIPEKAEKIVIAVHGFTSSKESPTVQLLMKRLPEKGLGVVGIDLPGHGMGSSLKEELRIGACLESVSAAEEHIASRFPEAEICYFASSFGAYITGIRISTEPHRGRKAFFRSPAVNMPSLFMRKDLTEEERAFFRELDEKGFAERSFDLGRPVRITRGFIDDLKSHDLFSLFDPEKYGHHSIAIARGEKDRVIDPAEAARFAAAFHIPETVFPGEGHSLSDDPGTPLLVADLAASLFLER